MGFLAQWSAGRRRTKTDRLVAVEYAKEAARASARGTSSIPATATTRFSAEDFLRLDVSHLQALAAELMWSSPHAKGAMRQLHVLAMGEGLRLQAQPGRQILGLDPAAAHELARQFEAVFELVRNQDECSHDGTRPYNGIELQGFWSWLTWNEVFQIQRYRDVGAVVPVSVEVINPASVKTPPSVQNLAEGSKITQGIEINKAGLHVAFWMELRSSTGSISYERVPYIVAGKVVGKHTFRTEVPGQIRATTRFLSVFHEMKRMQEALQLETDTMAMNARLAAFMERSEHVNNPDKLEAIAANGGDLSAIAPDLFKKNPGVSNLESENGGIIISTGEPGEKLVPYDTKRPNVNVNEFIYSCMTWIGPTIGIPVELWRALFGKSYSASKGSIDIGYKSFAQEVFEYSRGAEQKFYEAVIAGYVASGYLRLPKWGSPLMRAAYLLAKWSGPPKPALNPYQEEKAATERVNNWRSSVDRETQMNAGIPFDTVADRKEYELDRINRRMEEIAETEV